MENQTEPGQKAQPVALHMGGAVMAVVPQSFEELQRVANTIIAGGLAPAGLIRRLKESPTPEDIKLWREQNLAAVSGVLMAGAELGLPPMAALRMMTSINGRPVLYGDGNVAIVRRRRGDDGKPILESLRTGFTEARDWKCPCCDKVAQKPGQILMHMAAAHPAITIPNLPVSDFLEQTEPTDASFAWVEATRGDSGESYREEFSIADAKRAALWDDAETVTKEVWEYDEAAGKRKPKMKPVRNDSPWHRYPRRMMMWRATGYCLRWLCADILGGIIDEQEARSIGNIVDITPDTAPTPTATFTRTIDALPEFPVTDIDQSAPDQDPATDGLPNFDRPEGAKNEVPPPAAEPEPLDALAIVEFLDKLRDTLKAARSEAEVEEAFDAADVQTVLAHDELAIEEAFATKKSRLAEIARG